MKHIHFIGICGVAMSALAIALHNKGYKITGSDKGFYPPVSDYLKHAGVSYYPGWHPEKMVAEGKPDLVVVGNVAGSHNPEWQYVQEHTLEYVSYPELLAKEFIKKHSIVCAGTYGKSTSTAILQWILSSADMDPTYMFGGVSCADIPSAALTDSNWSIMEGDEYKSSRWDDCAKFYHYKPTHLLLTSTVWDHADVYPTRDSYIKAFSDLLEMAKDGVRVVSEKVSQHEPTLVEGLEAIRYGKGKHNDYSFDQVKTNRDGTSFMIHHADKSWIVQIPHLGAYMADNMTGCFALAHQIRIAPEVIVAALASFPNIKRRLERRLDGDILILDDIGHSPEKARAVLKSVQAITPGKVWAIFEPNTGNRQQISIPQYEGAFVSADHVIVPRLSKLKIDASKKQAPLDGAELAEVIGRSHTDARYIEDDSELIDSVTSAVSAGDTIIFLGSHGFRGMIEEMVRTLS